MTDELKPEVTEAAFVVSEELRKAVEGFIQTSSTRTFSERHPELGKMVNCAVCGTRHRQNERKCEQVFTSRIGDYELFRENEKGELVPDYRTCIEPGTKPTKRQVVGAAAFAKKRLKQHPSKIKLLLIQKTRRIFEEHHFELDGTKEQFEKNLQRARVLAAREIRREREFADRKVRRQQDLSRRINRGLLAH
jgi:hypothetical protein